MFLLRAQTEILDHLSICISDLIVALTFGCWWQLLTRAIKLLLHAQPQRTPHGSASDNTQRLARREQGLYESLHTGTHGAVTGGIREERRRPALVTRGLNLQDSRKVRSGRGGYNRCT